MNRVEFTVAISIILFLAFCIGWVVSWLVHRANRLTRADIGELDRMAQSLHEAEETRDQALSYMQQREGELTKQLSQNEAELTAAMEGLQAARQEVEDLRAKLGQTSGHGAD